MGQCTSVEIGPPRVLGRGKLRKGKSRKRLKSKRRSRSRDAREWGNEEEDDLKNTARTVDSDETSEEDNENERSGVLEGIVNIRTELEGEEEEGGDFGGSALDPMKSMAEELERCEEDIEMARKVLEGLPTDESQVKLELLEEVGEEEREGGEEGEGGETSIEVVEGKEEIHKELEKEGVVVKDGTEGNKAGKSDIEKVTEEGDGKDTESFGTAGATAEVEAAVDSGQGRDDAGGSEGMDSLTKEYEDIEVVDPADVRADILPTPPKQNLVRLLTEKGKVSGRVSEDVPAAISVSATD
ncbi:hypothetical protein TrRE_jg4847 [Triparma retinervis]|uniref:Uncharacterized protein n=1 Tax=Triparma retinervis TaxID=2557542 RepID=A0A9W6ZJB8_9STRA|nr:hypothetical protein TrRE_jg4847 [Triparma retinervis]